LRPPLEIMRKGWEIEKNKEIILLNRNVLKMFEKDIEAFEAAIRDYEERMGN